MDGYDSFVQTSFSRVENGAKSVPIRIALAQMNPRLGDVSANLELYEEKIRQAAKERADFLLFPELSLTGYFCVTRFRVLR
jgi:predicted amidohydrolase